jgi:hypothetical protein
VHATAETYLNGLSYFRFPAVAMGILKWVDYTLSEPSFFKLMTDSTPLHLALLDEVWNIILLSRAFRMLQSHMNAVLNIFLDKHVSSFATFASIVIIDQDI